MRNEFLKRLVKLMDVFAAMFHPEAGVNA